VSPGSHAAGDGSFGRSAGLQAGRAAVLIGVALLIGILLLHRTPGSGGGSGAIAIGDTTLPSSPGTSAPSPGSTTGTSARSTTPTSATAQLRAPQDIKVLVANGTTVAGLAGKISNQIHAKGYNTLASTNSTQKPASTMVYFQPSYSADAAALAAALKLPPSAVLAMPSPPPVSVLNGANILVVVGPDLASASTTSST
jgi:hypothetical protein